MLRDLLAIGAVALLALVVVWMVRAGGVPDIARIVPTTTTTDLVHLEPQGALAPAVRAPHHDDTFTVVMPIGEFSVIRGFQHLDEGAVTFVGEPCVHLHLAAHRSSHGAPFARLPETKPGDRWEVTSPSVACTYRVDKVESVTSNLEPAFGDLLAQCSLPSGFFLVFGTKV